VKSPVSSLPQVRFTADANVTHLRLPGGLKLIYEDSDLLVVDKPAGLLSIAAEGGPRATVYWIVACYLRKKGEKQPPAVVHRLDRDTSGLMLLVKSGRNKRLFMQNWQERVVRRSYLAVVEGVPPGDCGVIDAPLGEDGWGKVVVRKGGLHSKPGKPALTRWKKLETRGGRGGQGGQGGRTTLDVEIETGRRNQIRAHFAALGYPVAGDAKYGTDGINRKGSKHGKAGRLMLHAQTLAFIHPRTGLVMEFHSEPGW
jgi:23S rRNA pseudouridine1911/1915/1917 synthase